MPISSFRAQDHRPGAVAKLADVQQNSITHLTKAYKKGGRAVLLEVECYFLINDIERDETGKRTKVWRKKGMVKKQKASSGLPNRLWSSIEAAA